MIWLKRAEVRIGQGEVGGEREKRETLKYASVLRDASWLYIRCTKVYRCLHMIVGVVGAVDAHLASNHVE